MKVMGRTLDELHKILPAFEPTSKKNLFMPYANNKGADQPG